MRKKILLLVIAAFSIIGIDAITVVPVTSTAGNDVWYMIKCNPRKPDLPYATWITETADNKLDYLNYSGGDEQYWKVVANGSGLAIVNKKTGRYFDADNRKVQKEDGTYTIVRISTVATMPTTTLQMVPSTNKPDHKWPGWDGKNPGVYIVDKTGGTTTVSETNVITVADANNAFNVAIYAPASGDFYVANQPSWAENVNAAVLFRTKDEVTNEIKYSLKAVIDEVNATLESIAEGNNPGQFSSDAIGGMRDVLDAAQEVYDNPATPLNNFFTEADELRVVFQMFKDQVNLPEYSTSTNDVWYFIQGTRPENTYMTSLGAGAKIKDSKVIPNDSQLWKLVTNPAGGFALQNKATEEYINTDVASGTEFTTQPNMPANGLRFITSNVATNKSLRFWIENEASSTPALRFHAGGAGNSWNAMNWTGNKDDNCTWLVLSYIETLKANYKLAISDSEAYLATMVVGNEFGQYAKEVYDDFKSIIDDAKAEDVEDMTEEELLEGVTVLTEAQEMLVCNSDVATLQSDTPTSTDKWFRLVNAATVEYAKNKAMSSTGRNENDKFTFENINVDSDAQLFRFELKEGTASVSAIVNKANKMYVGSDGKILAENPGVDFSVIALDGFSFKIVPAGAAPLHAQQSGSHIVNWESGAGSASAWKFIYVKEASNIELLDNERTITVASANPAKGSAVLTGTTETSITTKNKNISVTATPNKGIFFAGWTNAAGDTISKSNPYVYSGTENITLNANFIDGYYRTMKRFYVAAKPSVQQTNRYLQAASAKVGENTKQIFNDVTTNPNPIDESVTSGQVIGNALLDYTTASIEVPYQTASFDLTCVGRSSEDTEEDLRWTQQITFIDWDQDFNFTGANEKSEKNSEEGNDSTLIDPNGFTRTIAIPAGLAEGYYRMRVVYHEPTSATADWGTSIWSKSEIRNGVAYDFTIKYGTPNSVNRPSASNLKVYVVNNRIHVSGVENFELYNINGQRLDSKKSVEAGVYLVKAANDVQKVIVK